MSDTAQRLMDLAEAHIRDAGYGGFSFRDLAAEIGIKSASVHHHFPTKATMAAAVARRYGDRFLATVAPRPNETGEDAISAYREARELAEWKTIFKRDDIKWAPLPGLDDVVKDPQMRAAEAFIKMDYPGVGVLETVNSPLFVSGVRKRNPTAAVEVGAHTRELLRELGYGADAIESIVRNGASR